MTLASGEPAFAPPTSSSVVPCPSAAGRTFNAIVKGALRLSVEPFVLPGDAGGPTFSPAEWPRVLSPDAPSPGSATSPSTSSGPISATLSSPCEVLSPAERLRGASAAEGASTPAEPFVPPRDASGSRFPPIERSGGRSPDAPSPTGFATSPSTSSGPSPRDAVVPLRGAPSGQESKRRSVLRRGGIPVSRTVCSARGCLRADVPPGQRAKGLVARCAVARIRDVAVYVVGTHLRDVVEAATRLFDSRTLEDFFLQRRVQSDRN